MHPIPNHEKITTQIIQNYEMELKHISTELNERIAQNLYSLYNIIQFMEKNLEQAEARTSAIEIIKSIKRTIEELRWMSVEIHPGSLESQGLLAALKSYLKVFTSTFGIIIDFQSIGEEKRLPFLMETIIFRVCKELLKNTAKHADTEKVRMIVKWEGSCLTLLIEDFGIGFDMNKKEQDQLLGIASIEERIKLIGGTFHITSLLGNGTTAEISVPIER